MATDIKFVLVATGLNRRGSKDIFTVRAERHTKWMVRNLDAGKHKPTSLIKPPARVRFLHFDWWNDEVTVYEHEFPLKGRKAYQSKNWKTLDAFSSTVGDDSQKPKTFVTASRPLSIVDMYRAVRKAPRGSVLDFSVYSHGFVEGPVLADTDDQGKTASSGEPIRDDDDRDGRVRTDFTPHMGEKDPVANKEALKNFREGFAVGATFRVFGCDVQDIVDGTDFGGEKRSLVRSTVQQVLQAAYIRPKKAKTALAAKLRKGQKPTAIELDMAQEFAVEDDLNDRPGSAFDKFDAKQLKVLHYRRDATFFPSIPAAPAVAAGKLTRSMSDVIKYIARETKLTYIFAAGTALPNVACFGAVPGTGGDFEEDGDKLMLVPRKTYGGVIQFYMVFIRLKFDSRNYGRFDAAGVAKINDAATNG